MEINLENNMLLGEMKRLKKELGLTLEDIAERSGVPLSTVQKIFAGVTTRPRAETMNMLERVFLMARADHYYHSDYDKDALYVRESSLLDLYDAVSAKSEEIRLGNIEVEPERFDPDRRDYTIEDYIRYSAEMNLELIDGRLYDMATPTWKHQLIAGLIYTELMNFAELHDFECMPYISPLDVRLDRDERTMVEPDVFVVCGDGGDGNLRYIEGAPDFIIEILSPSTAGKDATVKLTKYLKSGVREYWMVDPDNEEVMAFDFEHGRIFNRYSFNETVPVGISGGELSIDFARINKIISMKMRKEAE